MAQTFEINATTRLAGKGNSRQLRLSKQIPAVIYGPKQEPMSISIDEADALRYGRHGFENTIFTLKSKDSKVNGVKVLRKDLDLHPLSRKPIHFDFFAPDMTKTVRVSVEIKYTGKAEGTKEGGVFNAVMREVEVECLPTEIPESIEIDVTALQVDESFHVSDLQIPANIKLMTPADQTICTVAVVAEEKAPEPVVAAAAAPGAPAAGGAAAPAAAAPAAGKDKK